MPSAVDWSEFSVWCFSRENLDKLSLRTSSFGSAGGGSQAQPTPKQPQQPAALSTSAAASSVRAFVVNSLPNWHREETKQARRGAATSTQAVKGIFGKDSKEAARGPRWKGKAEKELKEGDGGYKGMSLKDANDALYLVGAQFTSGAVGGALATYSTHWLDTVKVKMQIFPSSYQSSTSCFHMTLKSEGLRGLYRGAAPAVLAHTCKTAIVFMSYGLCEEWMRKLAGIESDRDLSLRHHAATGAMTGVVASFVLCPLDLVKCRLQTQRQLATVLASEPKFSAKLNLRAPLNNCTTSSCMARSILSTDGVRGFYRGLPGIWVKEVPGSFIYFGSYETAKACLRDTTGHRQLDTGSIFVCGVFAGLCFCITHPIESVKSRVQVMSAISDTGGFLRAFVHILRTEGFRPLCSGIKPSMLRACLHSGIQFTTYETLRDFLLGKGRLGSNDSTKAN